MPALLCVFVYFAIVRILISEFRAPQKENAQTMQSDVVPHIHIVGPIVAIALTGLFITAFFYFGYVVAAAVYTFLIAFFFTFEEKGHWKRSALLGLLIAGCATLFGWLFFVELFGLYLPVWES